MELRRKRALDFYLGRPLLTFLQAVSWTLGSVVRRDHGTFPVRRILIAKFQGMGSLVIAKPAIRAIRQQYPDARIIFWGTRSTSLLAREMPEFDEIIEVDDRGMLSGVWSVVSTLMRLWRMPIDWAFDLEAYSRFSSVLVTLSGARNRTGFALEQLRARRVHTHLVFFNRYRYLGEAYARIFGQLLPDGASVELADFGKWRFALEPVPSLPANYVLLNVHAGELALERRWPREQFATLIDALATRYPTAHFVLIGHGAREQEYLKPLTSIRQVQDVCGMLSLPETIRAIASARLVVTGDTAPLHFAVATRTPVVGLFGPTRADTYLLPEESLATAVQVPIYCSPCVHHWEPSPCDGDNQCMKQLAPAVVAARCLEMLEREKPNGSRRLLPLYEAPLHNGSHFYPGLVYRRAQGHA